jgi:hypothetical protein
MKSTQKVITQAEIDRAKREVKIEMGLEIGRGKRVPKDLEEEFEKQWCEVRASVHCVTASS